MDINGTASIKIVEMSCCFLDHGYSCGAHCMAYRSGCCRLLEGLDAIGRLAFSLTADIHKEQSYPSSSPPPVVIPTGPAR